MLQYIDMNWWVVVLVILLLVHIYQMNSSRVYWFYSPTCGHCQNMEAAWEELESTMLMMVKPVRINIKDEINRAMADNFGVDSVPTIYKVDPTGQRELYQGDRSPEDLVAWARKSI